MFEHFASKSADICVLFGILGETAARKKGMHFGPKVWIFMLFFSVLERLQHAKRACILEQKCGFLCLFGLLGGGAALKKSLHFKAKVWISVPFGGCWLGLRSGKKVCILSASVDFHTLFGLVGKVCGAEKGHAFWSKSVDFYAIFGLLGKGRGVEKRQAVQGFRTEIKKIIV